MSVVCFCFFLIFPTLTSSPILLIEYSVHHCVLPDCIGIIVDGGKQVCLVCLVCLVLVICTRYGTCVPGTALWVSVGVSGYQVWNEEWGMGE